MDNQIIHSPSGGAPLRSFSMKPFNTWMTPRRSLDSNAVLPATPWLLSSTIGFFRPSLPTQHVTRVPAYW